jgi:integrase
MVDAGTVDGRRRRLFRATEAQARALSKQISQDRKEAGRSWTNLDARGRARAVGILAEIRRAGFTLDQVWDAFRLGQTAPALKPTPLRQVIQEVIAAKFAANRRREYIQSLEWFLTRFARGREALPVHQVGAAAVAEWLDHAARTPSSRATWRNRLSTLFDFAWRRGYILQNPCLRLERVSVECGRPAVLTVDQAKALGAEIAARHRPMAPYLALTLFAGVRPHEARRIHWRDVDLERGLLTVDAAASKVRQRRLVKLPEAARAWLALGGELPPGRNFRRRWMAARAAAGLREWPRDVLRHTAASYLVAELGARAAAELLGHSEGVLFRHYRELVTPEASRAFWSLRPGSR